MGSSCSTCCTRDGGMPTTVINRLYCCSCTSGQPTTYQVPKMATRLQERLIEPSNQHWIKPQLDTQLKPHHQRYTGPGNVAAPVFVSEYGPEDGEVREQAGRESQPGSFIQLGRETEGVFEAHIRVKVARSVGIIHGPGGMTGTGFRVGRNFIFTALHVLEAILNSTNEYPSVNLPSEEAARYDSLNDTSIYVDFGYLLDSGPLDNTQRFYFMDRVLFADVDCDVAVLELWHPYNIDMPPPFMCFSDPRPNRLFHLIGHSGGHRKHFAKVEGIIDLTREVNQRRLAAVREWSKALIRDRITGVGVDGYRGADNMNRVIFRTDFGKGASGSPGVVVLGDGRVVVVTMLVHGYPDWYYSPTVPEQVKLQCTAAHRIEQGTRMSAIYERMSEPIRDAIFKHYEQTAVQETAR